MPSRTMAWSSAIRILTVDTAWAALDTRITSARGSAQNPAPALSRAYGLPPGPAIRRRTDLGVAGETAGSARDPMAATGPRGLDYR